MRLPVGKFFPEWIYASFCRSDQTCSLPGGLICEPVVAYVTLYTLLAVQFISEDIT